MMHLKRYLKPYLGMFCIAIALLATQAMLDLELPNVMSEIVDSGIQSGGITESAPKAISQQSMALMQHFMTEEDAQLVAQHYATPADLAQTQETYTNATQDTFVQADVSDETQQTLDAIFGRASYAIVHTMQQMQSKMGTVNASENTDAQMGMDANALQQLAPMLSQLPDAVLQESIALAGELDQTTTGHVATLFVKAFYTELGVDTDAIQTNFIATTGVKMVGICFLILACAIGAGYFLSRMGAGVAHDLRRDVFTQVTQFTNNEMDKFSTASLITRTTNDITQVQMFLSMGLRMICFAPIMGIGGMYMAVTKCVSMTWVIALAVIVMLGVIGVIMVLAVPRFKKMQSLVDRLNLVSRESLTGMLVIRAFSTQSFEEDRFDKANTDLTQNTLFVNRMMAVLMPTITLVMNAVMLLIVWVGSEQISQSAMQVGDMMAFIQYAMQVVMSFLMISIMFVLVPRASVSATRVHEVLSTESTVKDPATAKTFPQPLRGEIQFNDVTFAYDGAQEAVLEHIDFTAKAGQTTAFIGSTGSGKSTLVNLIPRFYDATKGSITIDGIDVRDVTQHDLRAQIGYVPQKGMLFSGDITSNLLYGDENATQETLDAAVKTAQAMDFISASDDGFATAISQGGTNVSGGQRQRLSIARALVKKAPVYIFDDTFSALDFKTDAKLRAELGTYTGGATVLIVAQRISTIMRADQIIVLDEGKIVGKGTHQNLLQTCETYREIAQSQLSKEELEA